MTLFRHNTHPKCDTITPGALSAPESTYHIDTNNKRQGAMTSQCLWAAWYLELGGLEWQNLDMYCTIYIGVVTVYSTIFRCEFLLILNEIKCLQHLESFGKSCQYYLLRTYFQFMSEKHVIYSRRKFCCSHFTWKWKWKWRTGQKKINSCTKYIFS